MTNTPPGGDPRYFPIRFGAQLREHVRALRKDAGVTQAQLGQRLGVGQARIAEIESNVAAISVEQLIRLLSALGAELAISAAESHPVEAAASDPGKKAAPAQRPRTVRAGKRSGGAVRVTSGRNFILPPKKGSW